MLMTVSDEGFMKSRATMSGISQNEGFCSVSQSVSHFTVPTRAFCSVNSVRFSRRNLAPSLPFRTQKNKKGRAQCAQWPQFLQEFLPLSTSSSRHHSPRLSTRANSAPRDKRREARDREHDAIDDTSRPRPAAENMTNENETRTDGETPSPRQERSADESGADSRLRSDLPSLRDFGESSDSRGCSQAAL